MADKKLKVTLVRSAHGRIPGHKATLLGLGLKHQRQTRVLVDTPAVRGMINKVSYLIKTEEA